MNAAAREINQSSLFNGHLTEMRFSKPLCQQIILLVLVLASALAVVYVTNQHRLALSSFFGVMLSGIKNFIHMRFSIWHFFFNITSMNESA